MFSMRLRVADYLLVDKGYGRPAPSNVRSAFSDQERGSGHQRSDSQSKRNGGGGWVAWGVSSNRAVDMTSTISK
jgi:hypothetical protein